ncbi:MAG: PAS domain S-box protein [Acidobacteria bacterium]|nr:PAS domain S-box protein [Acidobacteriota bacterium]
MDGGLLYANAAFARLCGGDEHSLYQSRFQQLLTPGCAIFYETQFAPSLLLRGTLEEISFDLVRPDGQRVPIFVNATICPGDGPTAQYILLGAFGAKQRRLYEAELLRARRESEQVAEVVRRSSDAIIRLSADAVIESWNNGAQQIFGLSPAEASGKNLRTLFAEESHAHLDASIAELKRGIETISEITAIQKSGHLIDVSISMTPHLEAPGILVGFSAIIRDVTTRKRAERALLQSEKLASVGRLASSIAHEINNPLESVTNLLYILQMQVLDSDTKSLVTMAQEELARVSQIATHTLRFHKQSSGRTAVHLQTLFDSVLGLYRARLINSKIETTNDCMGYPELLCYEGELRQILLNLVANAFDAMRTGGKLVLRSRPARLPSGESAIRITVADTGSGMDASTLENLFEPFFSTKGIGGTGLGLWITKDLVAKNGGSIRVRSTTRPGRSGTAITMLFPLM